jgi:type II secretory pathway component PulF
MMHTPLAFHTRAELYAQLATMEAAGLPFDKALGLLRLPGPAQKRLQTMRKLLARRTDFCSAGEKSGVFTTLEASLLRAAVSAGSPARTYRRLTDYYTQRALHAKQLKSRLAMSAMVLLVALLVQPLPALVAGSLGVGAYLIHIFSPLIALACIAYLVVALPHWLRNAPVTPMRAAIDNLLPLLPLFGPMHVRHNLRDYFESLALLLEAGMPILDAFPRALATISNNAIKRALAGVGPRIEKGASLTQAISNLPYIGKSIGNSYVIDFVQTGEASGSLPEMLFRHAAAETASLQHFQQQLMDWLPRIIYAVIAGWVAYGILRGPGIAPRLPEDLR